MAPEPAATVVVVSRDRWSLASETLGLLLARTDPRHPVVVVDGRAPRRLRVELDRYAASGRVRVARRNRFLGSNEARNIGADGATTEWVAFVENDAVLSDGWLEKLLALGESRNAASVFPAYLERQPDGPIVHGIGADLEVGERAGVRYLREHQHHLGRRWEDVAGEVQPVARVQSEPHALAIRREVLEEMGGLDEALLSWFDHTDLALHHRERGLASWFAPHVTCTYLAPPPVAFEDVPSFLLRWGRDWYERSLDHLCRVWRLDRHSAEWSHHATYRRTVRRGAMTRWPRVNAVIDRAVVPAEWLAERWNDRAR